MKAPKTWILIADAGRARFYENTGPGRGLKELPGQAMEQTTAPTRELGTERPGRSFDSAGKGRHALAPRVDWHEQAKEEFAKAVGARLNTARANRAFDRLVIVAPPKTLGHLRAALDRQTTALLAGEINKDLTALGPPELASHVAELIRI